MKTGKVSRKAPTTSRAAPSTAVIFAITLARARDED
jgi:hypothetical protein